MLKRSSYLGETADCRREGLILIQGLAARYNPSVPCLPVQSLNTCKHNSPDQCQNDSGFIEEYAKMYNEPKLLCVLACAQIQVKLPVIRDNPLH